MSKLRIPALLYHRVVSAEVYRDICTGSEKIFSISKNKFEEQMAYLQRSGYTGVSLEDLVNYLEHKISLPPKPIIITFDDGQLSQMEIAVPILKKYGLKAVIFVTTNPEAAVFKDVEHIDKPLNREQIKKLSEEAISIQSHTVSHPILPLAKDEEILFEFKESKRVLEEITGKEIEFLSIPLGFYSERVKRLAKEAGYRAVCTANIGFNDRNTDLFGIRRITVEGTFDLKEFEKNLTALGVYQRKIVALVFKKIPPKIFGLKRWMKFRSWLFSTPFSYFLVLRRLKWLGLVMFLAMLLLIAILFLR